MIRAIRYAADLALAVAAVALVAVSYYLAPAAPDHWRL